MKAIAQEKQWVSDAEGSGCGECRVAELQFTKREVTYIEMGSIKRYTFTHNAGMYIFCECTLFKNLKEKLFYDLLLTQSQLVNGYRLAHLIRIQKITIKIF